MIYYFLKKDFEELIGRIEEVKKLIREALKSISESAQQESGNSFHDNFGFEEGNRQFIIWSNELKKLESIKNQACMVADNDKNNNVVEIGKTVAIQDENIGKIQKFMLRGYMVSPSENTISYLSPLGQALLGKKIGDVFEILIWKGGSKYKIIEIQ